MTAGPRWTISAGEPAIVRQAASPTVFSLSIFAVALLLNKATAFAAASLEARPIVLMTLMAFIGILLGAQLADDGRGALLLNVRVGQEGALVQHQLRLIVAVGAAEQKSGFVRDIVAIRHVLVAEPGCIGLGEIPVVEDVRGVARDERRQLDLRASVVDFSVVEGNLVVIPRGLRPLVHRRRGEDRDRPGTQNERRLMSAVRSKVLGIEEACPHRSTADAESGDVQSKASSQQREEVRHVSAVGLDVEKRVQEALNIQRV